MTKQERRPTDKRQDQSTPQYRQGEVTIPPDPEKIRRIATDKAHQTDDGDTALHHPDIEQEKNASRSGKKGVSRGQGRIVNPKDNAGNQYR